MSTGIPTEPQGSMSPVLKARIAGVFYLLTFVTGFAAMAMAGWTVANMISTVCYVFVTVLFYSLFKPVSAVLSLIAALFSLAGCALTFLNAFHVLPFNLNPLALFGVYCVLIGWLIVRSTFLPRLLGVLMAIGGLGWLTFASPSAKHLIPYNMIPGIVAEGALTVWLLIKGVSAARWHELSRTGA
jgi:hypothetical protein